MCLSTGLFISGWNEISDRKRAECQWPAEYHLCFGRQWGNMDSPSWICWCEFLSSELALIFSCEQMVLCLFCFWKIARIPLFENPHGTFNWTIASAMIDWNGWIFYVTLSCSLCEFNHDQSINQSIIQLFCAILIMHVASVDGRFRLGIIVQNHICGLSWLKHYRIIEVDYRLD